jgi:hypothetical protein
MFLFAAVPAPTSRRNDLEAIKYSRAQSASKTRVAGRRKWLSH